MHYLDHADHSWPKPAAVYQAMDRAAEFSVLEATRLVEDEQTALRELLNAPDAAGFRFTESLADAYADALQTVNWQPGDGIAISALEHQALVIACLQLARTQGVQLYIVPYSPETPFDLAECAALLKAHPQIRLLAVSHASPVVGCLLPIEDIARLAQRYGQRLLLDASQSAGLMPIHMARDGIDLLVLSAEKALQGPSGLSVLCVDAAMTQENPVLQADSSGNASAEAGSAFAQAPYCGQQLRKITAFVEGLQWVRQTGVSAIRKHTARLFCQLHDGLGEIPEVTVYGSVEADRHLPLLSFNVLNHHPLSLAEQLFQEFQIRVQAGFHESRLSHEAIGTIHRGGTIRVSLGCQSRREDVDALLNALKTILLRSESDWALSYSRS